MKIEGATAIVTGGGSGMGAATCQALARHGAHVAVLDINADRCREVAASIGGKAFPVDVANRTQIHATMLDIRRQMGLAKILVTCAGVGDMQPFVSDDPEANYERMIRTININLVGSISIANLFSQQLAHQGSTFDEATVIFVASGAAFDGVKAAAAYCAAKGGIVSATHALARELCELRIRVNTISPGPMATPMLAGLPQSLLSDMTETIPFPRRAGSPEEFAALALHICENSFLNGAVIRLDGGHRTPFKS